MNARKEMSEKMGEYQHHDAVTGTAKQHVADSYTEHLSEAMGTSNAEFEKQVGDYTEMFAGIKSDSWGMCSQTNSTYVDCPVEPKTKEFAVTSYNPSTIVVGVQSFKVPPPSSAYDVSVYEDNEWKTAESDLLCYDFLVNDVEQSSY